MLPTTDKAINFSSGRWGNSTVEMLRELFGDSSRGLLGCDTV